MEVKAIPIYEYQCTQCGKTFEELQSFSDKPISRCPFCKGRVKKTDREKRSAWYLREAVSIAQTTVLPALLVLPVAALAPTMTVLPVIMGEVASSEDGHLGISFNCWMLVLFAFLWEQKKGSSVSVSPFWQEKEKIRRK